MTIVSVYRKDKTAVFASDFRSTTKGNQTDVSLKFTDIGNDIGLFFSGDASFWNENIQSIKEITKEVSFLNVWDREGPLYEVINNAYWSQKPRIRTRAIGFMINNQTQDNKMSTIDIHPGLGVRFVPLENNRSLVIGSGAFLTNIEERINKRILRDREEFGDDLYSLSDSMRKEILESLLNHGSSSFRKLGISPYMALHTLAGSHFMIRGEHIQGEVYSDKQNFKYDYSFLRDENSNQIKLIDHINDKQLLVDDVTNIDNSLSGDLFDPQQITSIFDPEVEFQNNDFVYLFHQWVTIHDEARFSNVERETISVFRSLKRISFKQVLNYDFRLSHSSEPISDIKDFPLKYLQNYPDCRDQYFVLTEIKDKQFLKELNQDQLFDHNWLSSYIEDYYRIFFVK
ncbi:hypothetical protein AAEO50_07160 [Rossellomorea oryzaecorticis]|uniref:Uncharacterized protein n=1 Tax=Rossellomorea oryzaecorticis TaxID=1396505 RepID=A0ABU9K985_9BACI